jgi:hypothetical protein
VIDALRAHTIPIVLIILALSQAVSAQVRPIGIIWQPPESITQARAEVELMRQNGISHVYTTSFPSDELLQVLRNNQMHLLVQHPAKYLTTWYLEHHRQELKTEIQQHWSRLRAYPYLTGYSLFFEGALNRIDFLGLVSELRPQGMSDKMAYYSSDMDPPTGYSLPMNRLGLVQSIDEVAYMTSSNESMNFLVNVTSTSPEYIGHWYELLKSSGSGRLYLPSEILFVNTAEYSTLLNLIKEIQSDPEYLLPVVSTPDTKHQDGYSVMFFLVVIVIFGVHYAFDPTYRKSLQRFFLSNRIFVDDLVHRRAKLTFSNYIVIVYISFLSGTFLMAITEFKVSTSGVELLSYFVPFLSTQNVLFFGFLAGSTIPIVVLALLIAWGGYMNKGTTHFISYMTIILWPNHLLFGVVIVSIVLAKILNDPYVAAIMSMFVVVMPIIAYSYGGFKLIRYSFRSGLPYLLLYFAPPFLILASLVWWLIHHTPVIQLAELMIILP